jgi:chaperonin GroEL
VALIQASAKAEQSVALEGDEATGASIVFRAIEAPIKQIAQNSGLSGDVVIDKVRSLPDGEGFNAATNEYVDLLAAGVADPVKVTRSALQNAASIAGLFLTPKPWWRTSRNHRQQLHPQLLTWATDRSNRNRLHG